MTRVKTSMPEGPCRQAIFLTAVNFVAARLAVFPVAVRDVRHARLVREGAASR
jgi:hypothetical protein